MLKSLYRCVILRKLDNGIIVSVRKFNQKMDEQNHKRQQNNFNDGNNSLNRFRKWVQIALEPQQPGFAFSLLSYNILSQQLLETHSYLYRDHQSQALQWRGRFYNIIGEILCYQPDIFCCQEVQKTHLQDIQTRLRSMNYDVIYKKRTGDKPDGCAIFFKRHLFHLVEHHKIEFEQPGVDLLDRENVAVVCKFELKSDPSTRFVVATTHLLYNPKRQDIRLAQIQILLAELDRIAKGPDAGTPGHSLPIILSGDFNFQPETAPYDLIVNGIVNYASLSRRALKSEGKCASNQANGRLLLPIKLGITDFCQHVNHEIKLYHSEFNKTKISHDIELTNDLVNMFQTGVLRHNLNFTSAYPITNQYVSTYQNRWILVDYIFFAAGSTNTNGMKLLSYYALPSADECESVGLRIPNETLGSDHLSIAARFFLASNRAGVANEKGTYDVVGSTKL